MGNLIETNDVLALTKETGFPKELDYQKHLQEPYKLSDFKDKIFHFKNKQKIRVYKIPPLRNWFVEDIEGDWVFWGLVEILEIHHDYQSQVTSGKFRIVHLHSPEEMKQLKKIFDKG